MPPSHTCCLGCSGLCRACAGRWAAGLKSEREKIQCAMACVGISCGGAPAPSNLLFSMRGGLDWPTSGITGNLPPHETPCRLAARAVRLPAQLGAGVWQYSGADTYDLRVATYDTAVAKAIATALATAAATASATATTATATARTHYCCCCSTTNRCLPPLLPPPTTT